MIIAECKTSTDKKLVDYLYTGEFKRVGCVFYHGLGDLVMFLRPFRSLRDLYPDISFQLIVQSCLSFEDVVPEAYFLQPGDMEALEKLDYDLIFKVHFPMSEGQIELTKGEFCCIEELGIPPISGHDILPLYNNKLVGVHFNITCLPGMANPDEETAKKIWSEIIEAGYIPIETHFEHLFHNPVNKKFDFVTCTVRGAKPKVSSLISLLRSCGHFIGVVSGNFHTATAVLPHNKIMLLEKDLRLECFTKSKDVSKISIRPGEYIDGSIKRWLSSGIKT